VTGTRPISLRARLLWLVAVALLPVALFALVSLIALGQQQRVQARQALVERARAMASAMDLELQVSVAALEVLSLSPALRRGDLRAFYDEARTAEKARDAWDGIIVVDAAGRRLMNTRVAWGGPLPGGASVLERDSFAAIRESLRPEVGGVVKGPRGKFLFPVRVAVAREGELRYVLTALVDPAAMLRILERQKPPPQSLSIIFDARLNIVARSREHTRYAGMPLSESLRALLGSAGEGWGVARTHEGDEIYTAFSRAGPGAWGVALGVDRRALDLPVWRSVAVSGAGLLLSLLAGGLVAVWLARRISGTIAERTMQLQLAIAELRLANEQLEAFSYSVSHDLRAPLRAIDGYANLVLLEPGVVLPGQAGERLRKVSASARQMARLIDALLAFSRLARQALQRRQVDVGALAAACAQELRGERTVEIGELPPAHADPELLRQVFANLIGNALKYSARAAAPRVEVGALAQAGETVYFVRDNGVGFDMQHAGKLFGVFQRLHADDDFEGTGVGLAIVQRIVQRHGGRVWAEAEPGRGATFYFTLGAAGPGAA
jgi:signal transduction histidine kinase